MTKLNEIGHVLVKLEEAQDSDKLSRERAREAMDFIDRHDGQWNDDDSQLFDNKPRFTFDLVSPIVDQTAGALEQKAFGIDIIPAGRGATKDVAKVYDGLVRNIQNNSGAKHIFNHTARNVVKCGFWATEIKYDYLSSDSFEQDIIIKSIPDAIDRVWFDPNASERDKSDATYCFKLQDMSLDAYKERWPDGKEVSIDNDHCGPRNYRTSGVDAADMVTVGQMYYMKSKDVEIVQMSTIRDPQTGKTVGGGQVLEVNEDYDKVIDELKAAGIFPTDKRRKIKIKKVYSRLFDGSDFLNEEQETIFRNWLPVVPEYGYFDRRNGQDVYRGIVQKSIDPQRGYNFTMSSQMERVALSPKPKYWMTAKMGLGYQDSLQSLNTNNEPVQLFNADPEMPGYPQFLGGAQPDPGMQMMSETLKNQINTSAGMFDASMGANPRAQSGVAIERLQDQGSVGNEAFTQSHEVFIAQVGRVIVDAIARAYSEENREIRSDGEDGNSELIVIKQPVQDQQTGKMVYLNDLSVGKFDVNVVAGPSFRSQQAKAVAGIVEIAQVDPSIMQMGQDILLDNLEFGGAKALSDRARAGLFQAGAIPQDQWTDEEAAQMQQMQQQPPKEDPMMVAAQAELMKAQADMQNAQNSAQQLQVDTQEKGAKIQLDQQRVQNETDKITLENNKITLGAQNNDRDNSVNEMALQLKAQAEMQKLNAQAINDAVKNLNTQADTLVKLQTAAQGPVTGAGLAINVAEQSEAVSEGQEGF